MHLIALLVAAAGLTAGCGAPSGRAAGSAAAETGGDEDDDWGEDDAEDFAGGTWAPSASLARVEDIPRAGEVEERPSRTGAVRLVALMPVDGTGNHIVEIVGLPALDPNVVVASLRAAHDQPRWVGCDQLAFVADGAESDVEDARHEGGVTPLGVQEAVQGRIGIAQLESAARATELVITSCDVEYSVARGPALLEAFVRRFRELTAVPTDVDTSDAALDEGSR